MVVVQGAAREGALYDLFALLGLLGARLLEEILLRCSFGMGPSASRVIRHGYGDRHTGGEQWEVAFGKGILYTYASSRWLPRAEWLT